MNIAFKFLCSSFVTVVAAANIFTTSAIAQATDPLRPKTGICSARSFTALDRTAALNVTSCERSQSRLTKLQQRKNTLDLQEQTNIANLENRYGVQITRCADSFLTPTNGTYPTAACAIIDEPSLSRAYTLVQARNQAKLNKDRRDAQYNSDVLALGAPCLKSTVVKALVAWTKQECSTLQAG